MKVWKTHTKTVATLAIGKFVAHETQLHCAGCKRIYRSKELSELVPHQGRFGFDVLVYIGKTLFQRCYSEKEIQEELLQKNIPISIRAIGNLSRKFILYLALAHKKCQKEIKKFMSSRGGYILHLDGTCEGESPHLMSTLDAISEIVLDNVKLPSENSDQIIPFLKRIKKTYGDPIALMHDMGKGIVTSIETVFPGINDYVCHYHFLRDIGKDLFGHEYQLILKALKKYRIRTSLGGTAKALKRKIDMDTKLTQCLNSYLQQQLKGKVTQPLLPTVSVYTLTCWILNTKSELNGYGFPFDQPHFVFYERLKMVMGVLETFSTSMKKDKSLAKLNKILSPVLNDRSLQKTAAKMQEKVETFNRLREAMQIALPEGKKGLNDDGDDVDMETIKEKVTLFRFSREINQAALTDMAYQKMVDQIDKYWDKLFADPITVTKSNGETIIIQPQRTNNILERDFRNIKRMYRKKNGSKKLGRTFKSIIANTLLVKNLENKNYMKILLNGREILEERFAEIDENLVRQELKKERLKQSEKLSPTMKKVLAIPDLPIKIGKVSTMSIAF
ncbi:MAG: transposase [Candidatus Kariarchaeaceae archaeon]